MLLFTINVQNNELVFLTITYIYIKKNFILFQATKQNFWK